MKKNNIVLIVLIFLLIIFIGGLTYYKFNNEKDNNQNKDTQDGQKLDIIEINNKKSGLEYSDNLDKEKYKNYVITDVLKECAYTFYDDNKSIIGKVYIDKDGNLYITNDLDYDIKKISDIKFKTLYTNNVDTYDGIYLWLISEDNKLYYIALTSNNIKNIKIERIYTKYDVLNFTNLTFDIDYGPSINSIMVVESDGNIYDISSGLRYKEDIQYLFDQVIVYGDKTMSNIYGNMIEEKNNNYKIKYIFRTSPNDFLRFNTITLITEDNDVIFISPGVANHMYRYYSKVKNISYGAKFPFMKSKLKLTFENNDNLEFDAYCSAYYCINKFNI